MAIFGLDTGQGPAMETAASMTPVGPVAPARRPVVAPRPPAPAPAAAPTGQPVMMDIDTVQRGASPADLAAASRAVNIEAATGAQGQPMPTYASDAANRATAVSRFLEGQLRNLEQPSRFGSIASALAQRMIAPGKTFSQHLADIEGAPIDRAYKIATAMAGLGKQSDQLTQKDLIPLMVARINAEARSGDKDSTAFLNFAKTLTAGASDAAGAMQIILEETEKAKRNNPQASAGEVFRSATPLITARFRSEGIDTGRKETVAKDEIQGGPVRDADGSVTSFIPYTTKGTLGRREQDLNSIYRDRGLVGVKQRLEAETARDQTQEQRQQATAAMKYRAGLADAASSIQLMADIRDRLDVQGDKAVGAAGNLSMALQGLAGQVGALTGLTWNNNSISAQDLNDPNYANFMWDKLKQNNANFAKAADSMISGANAAAAQEIKTNVMLLAFSVAKAIDPGGRLSDADVNRMLSAMASGGNLSTAAQMKTALTSLERFVRTSLRARRATITVPNLPDADEFINDFLSKGKKGPTQPAQTEVQAPAPAAAPPAQAARPTTRQEFDALPSGSVFIDPNGVTRKKP